jgi:ABC-type phosphate transport system substrate-binding protein
VEKLRKLALRYGLLAMASTASAVGNPTLVVVVNAKNSATTISSEDLKRIYLGKMRDFPKGEPITPIDQDSGSSVRTKFNAKVLEKSEKQLQTYWSVQIFTGKGTPPTIVSNDQEVLQWLTKNPQGIGYISKESLNPSVKAIYTIP